jgi:glycosyltransferase involved in cell wall biosynthesis
MRILIVNLTDIKGGAARAAYRLHKALLGEGGIESEMLVEYKYSDDFTVKTIHSGKLSHAWSVIRSGFDALPLKFYKERSKTEFSVSRTPCSGLVERINSINPDIVHLHLTVGAMLKIEDIPKIKVPIIWTLHDNWVFTGGCHIMWECEKYQDICGACPRLGSTSERDLSRKIFNRKQKVFSQIYNLTIIGVSNWIFECSKKSTLLKNRRHINLPNPLNTQVFKPCNKLESRELWNLKQDKILVLFGAMNATSNVNKGFKELTQAMHKLINKDIELVVFGSSKPQDIPNFGFKIHYVGSLADDVSLVTLYSAVDVMVVPSLQEVFGQTASEAMSCGTPVVAFATTGLLDIVDHKENGYLAKPFDSNDLANGIEWVINSSRYSELCNSAREKVLREFDRKVVVKKYIKLYQEVLDG